MMMIIFYDDNDYDYDYDDLGSLAYHRIPGYYDDDNDDDNDDNDDEDDDDDDDDDDGDDCMITSAASACQGIINGQIDDNSDDDHDPYDPGNQDDPDDHGPDDDLDDLGDTYYHFDKAITARKLPIQEPECDINTKQYIVQPKSKMYY